MLHLLPPSQKKMILNEYRKRLAVLACTFVILLAVAGMILLIPSYIAAKDKFTKIDDRKQLLISQIAALSTEKTGGIVNDIAEKTTALSPLGAKENASNVFDALISRVNPGIVIGHYGYLLNSDKTLTFDVGGAAASRDSLISFTNVLAGSNVFTGAKLPLSTLRSERNIDFIFKLGVKNIANALALPQATSTDKNKK